MKDTDNGEHGRTIYEEPLVIEEASQSSTAAQAALERAQLMLRSAESDTASVRQASSSMAAEKLPRRATSDPLHTRPDDRH